MDNSFQRDESDNLIGREKCFNLNPGISMTYENALHCHTLLPTIKFKVLHSLNTGRELITTKYFSFGDLIVMESPLVVFRDSMDLITQLVSMSPLQRLELFDMHGLATPDKAEHYACQAVMERVLKQSITCHKCLSEINAINVSVEEVFQCLSIVHLNAHSFCPTEREPDRAALFPVSAKIAHSCLPNSVYSVSEHGLDYYALQPLPAGSLVTASYLDSETLAASTEERRRRLMRSKDFFCMCVKCRRPDYAAALPCTRCRGGITLCTRFETNCNIASGKVADNNSTWHCVSCGSRDLPLLGTSDSIKREYNALQDCDNVHEYVDKLEALLRSAEPDLGYTHYLLVEMGAELATVHLAMAQAMLMNKDRDGEYASDDSLSDVLSHGHAAIDELTTVCKRIECADAMCVGPGSPQGHKHSKHLELEHPPSQTAAPFVYRLCASVKRLNSSNTNNYKFTLPAWVHAYKPLLSVLYGSNNIVVVSLFR